MSSDLVALAIAGHGGSGFIAAKRPVRARLRLRGNILATRLRSPLLRPYEILVDTGRIHARIEPFHRPGRAGIFAGDTVSIVEGGATVASRTGARAHARENRRWDELDLLYFVGYALWNYIMTPWYFEWPGFVTREVEPWSGLRRLEVTYPEGFPTHSAVQTFYFDDAGRLHRLDYVAEVFGRWARGAHLCEDHRELGGLIVPTHRHVRLYDRALRPMRRLPAAMEGWVDSIEIG
jgi:hypothetical protein